MLVRSLALPSFGLIACLIASLVGGLIACADPSRDREPPRTISRDAGTADAGATEDGGPMPTEDSGVTAEDAGIDEDAGHAEDATPGDADLAVRCVAPERIDPTGTELWEDALGRATVTVADRDACRRSYTLRTTAALRDNQPANPRTLVERPGASTLRTGHDLFDALYALALEEVRECSVETITDGAFNGGQPVPCGPHGCFETGRLWRYVWTRDTAYAVDLGLAAVDPLRSLGSLEIKLSERRGGGDLQIVQDTGTGGSYPVSTDRVAWAVGAWELLRQLEPAARSAFAARTYTAVRNTVEHDRRIAFDPLDGLYTGEQSFLDWREQSYPEWTADDVVHIGMSKALSTNLLHLRALELASFLAAEAGEAAARDRYRGFADQLRSAIQSRFWSESAGLFSTYVTTTLDPAPVRRFDLLGSSFAVLFGVASEAQARRVLASYPHYGPGAPVIWPQQQLTPIYHNRGEWPFVTAYWLRAAKRAGNDAVADRMVRALIRGAAINLSNMENFEAATGSPRLEEGLYTAPVVNSQRQLWSVAGYLSMVHHTIFGLEAEDDGLHLRPYVTAGLRRSLFAGTDALVLNEYPWRGRRLTVVLHLPNEAGRGVLRVESIQLNGQALAGDHLADGMLAVENRVDVFLGPGVAEAASLTQVFDADWRDVFGPRTPRIPALGEVAGRLQLTLDARGEDRATVTWTIYRDGAMVATGLPGSLTTWSDPNSDPGAPSSPCYTAELTFIGSGNHSQHAPPHCWWGRGASHIVTIGAAQMQNIGGALSTNHGRPHFELWGDPGHSLITPIFTATRTGPHLFQVVFGNGAGPIDTGITCAVKRLVVEEQGSGRVAGEGALIMPHLATWARWEDSNFIRAELVAGRSYRVEIHADDAMVNMSAFSHFEAYTGGRGGRQGEHNRVNIAELLILAL